MQGVHLAVCPTESGPDCCGIQLCAIRVRGNQMTTSAKQTHTLGRNQAALVCEKKAVEKKTNHSPCMIQYVRAVFLFENWINVQKDMHLLKCNMSNMSIPM